MAILRWLIVIEAFAMPIALCVSIPNGRGKWWSIALFAVLIAIKGAQFMRQVSSVL